MSMQRGRRRLVCSTAPLSSPSSVTLRPRRRRSRTSAGGDGFTESNHPVSLSNGAEAKMKPRSTKCNMRMLSRSLRNSRKVGKTSKGLKPTLDSLQNTIVLAPFHTLKRCFQLKLIELYSREKLKKLNDKKKLAMRKNMAFEYEVVEMDPFNSKTEKRPARKAAHREKSKQQCKSRSYCQCDKKEMKSGSLSRQRKRSSTIAQLEPFNRRPSFLRMPVDRKRRKTNNSLYVGANLKMDSSSPSLNFLDKCDETFYALRLSNTNLSMSAGSSQWGMDSWETFSNSPSFMEEPLEGSMAISTTSFDSYQEQFEKESCIYPESRNTKSRRSALRENGIKRKDGNSPVDDDFMVKPTLHDSKHLIVKEPGNSDGHITGFLDREPQAHLISMEKVDQHLQPLQRQSKTKTKKPGSSSTKEYYLRSVSSSSGRSHKVTHVDPARDNKFSRRRSAEVGTQVEESIPQKNSQPLNALDLKPEIRTPERSVSQPKSPNVSSVIDENLPDLNSPIAELTLENPPSEVETTEAAVDNETTIQNLETVPEEQSESFEVASRNGDGYVYEESFNSNAETPQPEEKESDFIFGRRATPTRIGEPCEFSFGMNWEFSDNDSEQGDHFF